MSNQKSRHRKKAEKKRNSTSSVVGILLFIVIVVIAVGSVYYGLMPTGQQSQTGTSANGLPAGDPTLTTCVSSPANVLVSFKVNIRIVLSGVEFKIPAKIGEEAGCTRPLHTLDTSGDVYVTSPVQYAYTLQDFFAVWGQVFTRTQIFTLHADSNHQIALTVNGKVNDEYENYILADGDQILITFT